VTESRRASVSPGLVPGSAPLPRQRGRRRNDRGRAPAQRRQPRCLPVPPTRRRRSAPSPPAPSRGLPSVFTAEASSARYEKRLGRTLPSGGCHRGRWIRN